MNPCVRLLAAVALGCLPAAAALGAENDAYPRPQLLLEPEELAKPEVAAEFVILDARSHRKYEQGHVPGATWVDHDAWKSAFGDGQDAEGWSRRIGRLAVRSDSKVVVYDDQSQKDAARIWWILRYWGARDVRLLNGGWHAWRSQKLPVSTRQPEPRGQVEFRAERSPRRLLTKTQLLARLKDPKLQIVDARCEAEFCGTDRSSNRRGGAIPGARQLEWSALIDPTTQRFKTAAELRRTFVNAGVNLGRPTATHCQSGGRASVMAFGLELMGATDVQNYYRGWSEWGNADDTPIVPGKKK